MSQGRAKKRKSGVSSGENLTFSSESEVSEPLMSEGPVKKRKRSSRSGVKKVADTKLTFSSESEVSNSVKIEGRGNNKKRSSRSGVKKVAATKLTFSSESEVSEPKMSEGQRNDKKRSSRRGVNKMADTKLTFSSENEVSNSVKIEGRGNNKKRSSRSGVKKVAATKLTFSSESEVSEPKMSEGQRNDKKRSSRRGVNKMADTKLTFSSENEVSNSVKIEGRGNNKKRSSRSGVKKVAATKLTFSSESEVSEPKMSEGQRNDKKRSSRRGVNKMADTKLTFSSENEVSNSVKIEGRGNNKKRSSRSGVKKVADTKLTFSSESEVSEPVPSNGQRNTMNDTPTHTTVRCTFPGCTINFKSIDSMRVHNRQTHKHLRCGVCSNIYNIKKFNNIHLKNNPTCAEVNPQPWDPVNKKEAQWILIRHDRDGKTTFGCKSGVFKNRKFQCPGCPMSFNSHRETQRHLNKIHRLVKCVVCNSITTIGKFNQTHKQKKLACGNVAPIPWITNEKDAEWFVARRMMKGKFVFCIQSVVKIAKQKFQCKEEGCIMSYATKLQLYAHTRLKHRYLKCGVCSKIFTIPQFNNTHLKFSPTCAQINPQPWDKENKKEAQWTVTRNVSGANTTFGMISAIYRKMEFQCTYHGCSMAFRYSTSLQIHVRLYHKHLKCGVCSEIHTIFSFNNKHLKNNLKCAEVNPQPWDKENKKKAEWILTRHDRRGKTTYGYKPGFFKYRKFQCKFPGCPMSFNNHRDALKHLNRHLRLVKCVVCSLITPLDAFASTHRRRKLSCGNVVPIPWVKNNQKDPDWFVERRKVRGQVFLCYKSKHGQVPESEADSDENITFGTESNVYINHFRIPQHLNRNSLNYMTCEVYGCSYHTTHSVVLRHHYKTHHSSLLTNWSVSFDAASKKIHQCLKPKCGFKTNSKQLFQSHNCRHTKLFSFQCFLCHQLYKTKNTVMEHLMETHKIFRNPSKFVVHICNQKSHPKRSMEGTSLFCNICNRQIQTRSLEKHMTSIHPPKLPQQNCQFCYPEAYCKRSSELNDNTTSLKCSYKTCCFETHTFQEFREHSLTHYFFRSQILAHETNISSSANVSFQCPRENCKFKTSSQLVLARHENKHKQGLSARCLLCNEICSNTEKFLSHVRIRHKIHTNQLALYEDSNEHNGILNIYRCNIESCTGFMSGVKSFYEDHLLHHLDHTINTFSCGLCSLPLDTGKDLIAHFERSHNKADLAIKSVNIPTTLSCDLCPHLVFQSNAIFIIHNQFHHSERVTSVVDQVYPDFYKKCRRFKTFSTSTFSAEGEV